MVLFTTFVNFRLLRDGQLHEGLQLVISPETGLVLHRTGYIGGDIVDLDDAIVAPGFLELQMNGWGGLHFTQLGETSVDEIEEKLRGVAEEMVKRGVTGWWATVPTVGREEWMKILPALKPRDFENASSLLGAHVEGPYLHPSKKGAHTAEHFVEPASTTAESLYGASNLASVVKLVTLAPELKDSFALIKDLKDRNIRVSLGHSTADYDTGVQALSAGANALTHVFNAMPPLHHREPGLAGLISSPHAPYFSIIADGIHLHQSTVSMAYRANPNKAILITDAIEMAGLPDGVYPGNAQIAHKQEKKGNRVVLEGTETLIGSCCGLDECVRNLVKFSGCELAEAVRCVTENVAEMMGLEDRGRLVEGRRADFVVLNDQGEVLQTWIAGKVAWDSGRPLS